MKLIDVWRRRKEPSKCDKKGQSKNIYQQKSIDRMQIRGGQQMYGIDLKTSNKGHENAEEMIEYWKQIENA